MNKIFEKIKLRLAEIKKLQEVKRAEQLELNTIYTKELHILRKANAKKAAKITADAMLEKKKGGGMDNFLNKMGKIGEKVNAVNDGVNETFGHSHFPDKKKQDKKQASTEMITFN